MKTLALLATICVLPAGCKPTVVDEPPPTGRGNHGPPPNSAARIAPATAFTDWVVVGGIAVRVTKVRLQKPVMENESYGFNGTKKSEYELGEPELVMWVEIENRTPTFKLDYRGWDSISSSAAVALRDEHGNRYAVRDHGGPSSWLKGRDRRGAIHPGDKPVTDVICFERPIAAAKNLKLTLPALVRETKSTYQFEIPAAAWK